VITFALLERACLTKADDHEQVEHGNGGDWDGEAERERVPDERLFGRHYTPFRKLDRARYATVLLNRPAHAHRRHAPVRK